MRRSDLIRTKCRSLFTPADIVTLPKGQAFALLEGGQPWKLRMPLPDQGHDPQMPASLQQMAAEMARRYTTSDHWWIEEPLKPVSMGAAAAATSTSSSEEVSVTAEEDG